MNIKENLKKLIEDMSITYWNFAIFAIANALVSMFIGLVGLKVSHYTEKPSETVILVAVMLIVLFLAVSSWIMKKRKDKFKAFTNVISLAGSFIGIGTFLCASSGVETFNFNMIFASFYLLFLIIAFFHDLKYEEKPKHLPIMFMIEFLLFAFLIPLFEIIASKFVYLLIFIVLLAICYAYIPFIAAPIGSAFVYIINAGTFIFPMIAGFAIPLAALALLAEAIAEFFA